MTDIERRALLGDRKAQEECTRRGIVLVCPFCGSKAERGANKRDSRKRYGVYHTIATVQCTACTAKVTMAGVYVETAYKYAEGRWNTRPAPTVGHCGECAHAKPFDSQYRLCDVHDSYMTPDGFCSEFKPKEGKENG